MVSGPPKGTHPGLREHILWGDQCSEWEDDLGGTRAGMEWNGRDLSLTTGPSLPTRDLLGPAERKWENHLKLEGQACDPKGGLGGTRCPTYSPRRVKPEPIAAPRGTRRRAADSGSAKTEGLTCISGALSVRSAWSPIACLSCRRGPSPSPAPLLRLLLQHLRPVRAPSQSWLSVCLSHAGGSPACRRAEARESGAEAEAAAVAS